MTRGGSRSYSPSNRSGARTTGGSYESSKRRPRRSSSRERANKKARGSTSPQSRERLRGRRASRSPSRERTKEKRPRGSPTRDEAPKRNESVDILRPPASHRHYYPAYHLPYAFPPYCPPPIPSYYQPPFLPQPSSHLQSPLIPSYPFPPQQNEAVYWQNTIQYADGLKKHAENQLAVVEKKKPEVNGEKEVIPFRKKIFVITLDVGSFIFQSKMRLSGQTSSCRSSSYSGHRGRTSSTCSTARASQSPPGFPEPRFGRNGSPCKRVR